MRTRLLSAVAICLLVSAAPLRAQDSAAAERVVAGYVAAMRANDWDQVSTYMHPDALAQFKGMMSETILLDGSGEALSTLFPGMDQATFDAAGPDVVFGSFMKTMATLAPGFSDIMSGSESTVIGAVPEANSDLTHVVYRMQMDIQGMAVSQVSVMTLKRSDGSWKAMLTAQLEGIGAMLRGQMR
jgi:hypothetical protein